MEFLTNYKLKDKIVFYIYKFYLDTNYDYFLCQYETYSETTDSNEDDEYNLENFKF